VDLRLKERRALVTAASRGLGRACAEALAAEGTKVFISSRDPAAIEQAGKAIKAAGWAAADVSKPGEPEGLVDLARAKLGGLDILVVNAGVLIRGGILEYRMEDLDRMLAVNVRGVVVAIQAAAAHMGQGGRVITIGSNTAVRTGFPGASIYSMTKGAIASLVRGVAIDLAPRGITVNNVQPGPTVTDMTSVPGMAEAVKPLIPLGRMGSTAEIAAMVAYLVGPESGFVTGASMTIDGGYVA
jgi:3-oxoacyl-[acyl-carrier protein] reductase